jgi:hypothetical protein
MRLKMDFEVGLLPKDVHRVALTLVKALIKTGDKELYQKFYNTGSNKHITKPFSFFYKPFNLNKNEILRVGYLIFADTLSIYFSTTDEKVKESITKGFYIFKGMDKNISYRINDKINNKLHGEAIPISLKEFSISLSNIVKIPSFVIPETFMDKNKNKEHIEIVTDYFKQFGMNIKIISLARQSTYTNINDANRQIRGFNLSFIILDNDVTSAWNVLENGVGARKSQGFGYCLPIIIQSNK